MSTCGSAVLLIVLLVVGSVSCSWYRRGQQVGPIPPPKEYDLAVVEFDDEGWLWNPEQLSAALQTASAAADQGGALIVAYIHGWHHSASPGDRDFQQFQKMLERLTQHAEVQDQASALHHVKTGRVVGIFIGWRGGSLPMPLDYLTFWDRKAASLRVGHGEVGEILASLHRIYRGHNDQGVFTNLITIGHSFGGSVLFSATNEVFKERLTLRKQPGPETNLRMKPAETDDVFEGVGDLVVLVNPAIEASQYQPIARLASGLAFPDSQHPVLLTVSAENDVPRKTWFPIGRFVSTLSEPYRNRDQKQQIRTAMGNYADQVTHCLRLAAGHPCKGAKIPCSEPTATEIAPQPSSAQRFTTSYKLDTILCPIKSGIDPANPFLVAQTTKQVIDGHNGQFSDVFREFLVDFITRTRSKRATVFEQRLRLEGKTPR